MTVLERVMADAVWELSRFDVELWIMHIFFLVHVLMYHCRRNSCKCVDIFAPLLLAMVQVYSHKEILEKFSLERYGNASKWGHTLTQ